MQITVILHFIRVLFELQITYIENLSILDVGFCVPN